MAVVVAQPLEDEADGRIRVPRASRAAHQAIRLGAYRNPVDVIAHQRVVLDYEQGNPKVDARDEERSVTHEGKRNHRQQHERDSPQPATDQTQAARPPTSAGPDLGGSAWSSPAASVRTTPIARTALRMGLSSARVHALTVHRLMVHGLMVHRVRG